MLTCFHVGHGEFIHTQSCGLIECDYWFVYSTAHVKFMYNEQLLVKWCVFQTFWTLKETIQFHLSIFSVDVNKLRNEKCVNLKLSIITDWMSRFSVTFTVFDVGLFSIQFMKIMSILRGSALKIHISSMIFITSRRFFNHELYRVLETI